jgi:two-component system chemotaxis response regulator CheY
MTTSLDLSELQVLIVDDIKSVRTMLGKSLKSLGIQYVNEASNIEDAMLTIKNKPVDLIFSDWNMQNGDGIDLLKSLRSSGEKRLKYMKFIMVTGSDDKVMTAMDEGAHNIIHKPFTPEIIMKKLELLYL